MLLPANFIRLLFLYKHGKIDTELEVFDLKQYTLGIDFGTLSARALLIELDSGHVAADAEFTYPHGILTNEFFGSVAGKTEAYQHPQDYLDAMEHLVAQVLAESGAAAGQISGLGIDFTSCTMLPLTADGTPLCFLPQFQNQPQAYIKLWKHHGAQPQADRITALATETRQPWLARYGGKISSEWMLPKLLETLETAPDVFDATARFVEAGDWLVWLMTGNECHSSCMAGYKGLWSKAAGYPDNGFLRQLDTRLDGLVGSRISPDVHTVGAAHGVACTRTAAAFGLTSATTVCVPIIDAHAALPAAGVVSDGKLMLILGTSACHLIMAKHDVPVPGICGSVEDGIVPGYVTYEAGQGGTGDIFDWYVRRCVPADYAKEAEMAGKSVFTLLDEKAARLRVGQSGLLALDWWNGNRSPLADSDLTGAIFGLSLATRPEEIYRALIEATAFGTKAIVDLYESHGVSVREIFAAGGIAQKNAFLMQVYADVLGKPIRVSGCKQAGSTGSAIIAAAACGHYPTLQAAAAVLGDPCEKEYVPDLKNTAKYALLYAEYQRLTDYFGRGGNNILKTLRDL